jgi:hypothetical protein
MRPLFIKANSKARLAVSLSATPKHTIIIRLSCLSFYRLCQSFCVFLCLNVGLSVCLSVLRVCMCVSKCTCSFERESVHLSTRGPPAAKKPLHKCSTPTLGAGHNCSVHAGICRCICSSERVGAGLPGVVRGKRVPATATFCVEISTYTSHPL